MAIFAKIYAVQAFTMTDSPKNGEKHTENTQNDKKHQFYMFNTKMQQQRR